MPKIAGIATAVPEYSLKQSDIKSFAQSIFSNSGNIDRLLPVFDNALIEERHFAVDLEWFATPHSFTEVNDLYIEKALDLSEEVVLKLARSCNMATTEFDMIIFVSTTGLSTPSIDARLANRVALNPHIKRLPIWGLGCAAGAGAIARAFDYARAYPSAKVLIVSVELCGLAFQRELSKHNIIASALFADGAAACLVVGDEVKIENDTIAHPKILASLSTIYPDTLDVMGWTVTSDGFKLLLSKDIPTIVTEEVKQNVTELLEREGISLADIRHFVTHPGGAKVLDAYQDALALKPDDLRHARNVLKWNGNMSSATVFFILHETLKETLDETGSYGLVSALGPGFSSELVLIHW
jgi:alkylresorcinol/alkylpyrone synthase